MEKTPVLVVIDDNRESNGERTPRAFPDTMPRVGCELSQQEIVANPIMSKERKAKFRGVGCLPWQRWGSDDDNPQRLLQTFATTKFLLQHVFARRTERLAAGFC